MALQVEFETRLSPHRGAGHDSRPWEHDEVLKLLEQAADCAREAGNYALAFDLDLYARGFRR